MKLRILTLITLLALLLSLVACNGDGGVNLPTPPDGMQLAATCEEYTFFVPEDWTVDTSTGVPMAFVSEVDTSNVTLVRVSGATDPVAFFEASLPTLRTTFAEFAMVYESNTATLGGKPAIIRTFRGLLSGGDYTVKQYIAAVGDAVYIMTYTAKNEIPSGKLTYFERYEDMVAEAAAALLFEGVDATVATEEEEPIVKDGLLLASDPRISPYSLYLPEEYRVVLQNGTTSATRDGVAITVQYEYPQEATPGEYWEARCASYRSLYSDFTLIDAECSDYAATPEDVEVWMDGHQMVRYVFTFTRGGVTYKCQKLLTVNSSYVYTLTYTARLTPCEDGTVPYTAHLDDLNAIIAAFTFD